MKYKILEQNKNNIQIFCIYDDKTYAILDLVAGRELEEILQDAYILSKNKENRQACAGEEIEDLKDYVAKPKVTRLDVDFYRLTGKVYDQYGAAMDVPMVFTIDGQGAVIKDRELVTEEVDAETTFFIVAKCGDLEERQERTLYPPVEPGELPDAEAPVSRSEFDEIKAALDDVSIAMAEMIGG